LLLLYLNQNLALFLGVRNFAFYYPLLLYWNYKTRGTIRILPFVLKLQDMWNNTHTSHGLWWDKRTKSYSLWQKWSKERRKSQLSLLITPTGKKTSWCVQIFMPSWLDDFYFLFRGQNSGYLVHWLLEGLVTLHRHRNAEALPLAVLMPDGCTGNIRIRIMVRALDIS